MKYSIKNVPKQELISIIQNCDSRAEVLESLGYSLVGSAYSSLKKRCDKDKISLDDLDERARGKCISKLVHNEPAKFEDLFCENSTISRNQVRKRIIKDNLIDYNCNKCQLKNWQGEEISLQLDHINGINNDHRLENLRWLCPNCHSQTKTYAGRNIKSKKFKESNKKIKYCDCGNAISIKSNNCRSCAAKNCSKEKITWPSREYILKRLKETSYAALARELGVSDNSIRKFLKRTEI